MSGPASPGNHPPARPGNHPPARARNHPLGTAGLALSVCTLFPLPAVGGVVGSLLGAFGGRAARRSEGRFRADRADLAIGIGLVFGAIPLLVLTAVRADEWTWIPFGLAVAHVAVVSGVAASGRAAGPGAVAGAAAGTAGVLGATGGVVALAFALLAFLVFLGKLVWNTVF